MTTSTLQRDQTALRRLCGPVFLECLDDPLTQELMLNPDGTLWHECFGMDMVPVGTIDPAAAEAILRMVAGCLDKVITWEQPQLDGEFPLDGSRFSGALPPIVSNPTFTLRKPASRSFTLEEYVFHETMTEAQKDILCQAIDEKKNILVIGGTSSGKTTLVNALIDQMVRRTPHERHLIIEDTREIRCSAPNVVFFHTTDEVPMTLCLKQCLRFRPDRIHVGEVRDESALDLLDAWNTGHEGGVATVHANSARLGLSRLRGLISRNRYAPNHIEEIIGEAVHRIVFIAKTPEGRRIKEILAVDGYSHAKRDYLAHNIG
ncbi:MAG: P-type conjugative transfer ATPase TrbB [Bilophila wadsworthia]|uniref:P-type conjugative transfer ATPase TrbB n=1 Tax=Bilophila wadsworthia TaxID=35833 RepID=UPI00290B0A3D|nr:P-type conjugative transfer ATPase TrbB [Bilophila wadsworthia]MDU4377000.1 P-type conjugative transfer ATPase TrbB [Bilophila wadsworthia]